jgi:hypothetical protein
VIGGHFTDARILRLWLLQKYSYSCEDLKGLVFITVVGIRMDFFSVWSICNKLEGAIHLGLHIKLGQESLEDVIVAFCLNKHR